MTRALQRISNAQARRLLLARQGLCRTPRRKLDAAGLLALIEDLGFVQIDSIATVARAHHMILFARNETYRPALLARLLEQNRSLFENWTHDASIIPSRFYPSWRRRFQRDASALAQGYRDWHDNRFEAHLEELVVRIRDKGPVMARDFKRPEKVASGGWWNWHPTKTALEYLWRTGVLAVTRREGFQKVYDLSERVIPAEHLGAEIDHQSWLDWCCWEALDRLGVATSGELAQFWDSVRAAEAKAWVEEARDRGALEEFEIACADGRAFKVYGRPGLVETLADLPEPPPRLRALSPFDPVIRDRKRLQRLFGTDYRIEIFVPEAQRRYGYYVFPLLEGDRFVGRIDMRHDKAGDRLRVSALWPEPGVKWGKRRQQALEAELDRQRRFLGAADLDFETGWLRDPVAGKM